MIRRSRKIHACPERLALENMHYIIPSYRTVVVVMCVVPVAVVVVVVVVVFVFVVVVVVVVVVA